MRHVLSKPSERVTSFAVSGVTNYSRPPQHSPRLVFVFPRGDGPPWEADGEVTHAGLLALDSLIPGGKQEHKPSLRFGCRLCFVSNTDLNSGSISVWLCLRKARPLHFLQQVSLLSFHFLSTLSQCLRGCRPSCSGWLLRARKIASK